MHVAGYKDIKSTLCTNNDEISAYIQWHVISMQLGWGGYPDGIPGVSYSNESVLLTSMVETLNSWSVLFVALRLSLSPHVLMEIMHQGRAHNCMRHT